MPENAPPVSALQGRLHEVAQLLRESSAVDPDSRQILAELVDYISDRKDVWWATHAQVAEYVRDHAATSAPD